MFTLLSSLLKTRINREESTGYTEAVKPEKDELSADKGSDRVRESFGTSSQPSLHGVTDRLTVALPNSAEKEASVDQLMGSPRQKLSH